MTTRYAITVWTVITHGDGSPFWRDEMRWAGVDDEVRDWLAGSCKTALFRMIGLPEVEAGPSYTVAYRTLVQAVDGSTISDTTLVEFPRLSYETMSEFQVWAMDELRAMHALLVRKHSAPPVLVKRRSRIGSLAGVLWQRLLAA